MNLKITKPWSILGILVLVFAIPLVLAFYTTQHHQQFGLGEKNHGELIDPPIQLGQFVLQTPQGTPISEKSWRKHWLLLYINQPRCDDPGCIKPFYNLRQIQAATGKDSERILRAVLSVENPLDAASQQLWAKAATDISQAILVSPPPHSPQETFAFQPGSIYLVDPLGNVLMRYPPNTDPMNIYKDLTLLLKISHIG